MPELHVSRERAAAGAVLLLVLLALAGKFVLGAGGAREGDAAAAAAALAPLRAERAPPLVVHVVGAVRRPGLYRLAAGKRVADAVAEAGGASPDADLATINLAAPVADGQQVVVPARVAAAAAGGAAAPAGDGTVHLNTATAAELDELPGVGPVTAAKIVEHRERHGPFASVRELDAIPGIGPARLEQLEGLVAP